MSVNNCILIYFEFETVAEGSFRLKSTDFSQISRSTISDFWTPV